MARKQPAAKKTMGKRRGKERRGERGETEKGNISTLAHRPTVIQRWKSVALASRMKVPAVYTGVFWDSNRHVATCYLCEVATALTFAAEVACAAPICRWCLGPLLSPFTTHVVTISLFPKKKNKVITGQPAWAYCPARYPVHLSYLHLLAFLFTPYVEPLQFFLSFYFLPPLPMHNFLPSIPLCSPYCFPSSSPRFGNLARFPRFLRFAKPRYTERILRWLQRFISP